MAIKRNPTAKPEAAAPEAPKLKRVAQAAASGDKESLQDRLVVVTMKDFDPRYVGNYQPTAKAVVDVLDVETGETRTGLWFFGNLASQLGTGLEVGELGVGRIVTGPTRSGTGQWWGFAFSDDDAEYDAAEAASAAAFEASEVAPF